MRQSGAHAYGMMLVATAAILWSTAGLFVRLLDLDVWTMLAWRSVFAALSLTFVVIVKNRRDTLRGVRAIGWPGLIAVPIAAISMGSYVVALKLTTVANVMVVYATVPFVAAGVAYVWIGERIGPDSFWRVRVPSGSGWSSGSSRAGRPSLAAGWCSPPLSGTCQGANTRPMRHIFLDPNSASSLFP